MEQQPLIVFDGDSICHATSEGRLCGGGYAQRVGEALGMRWVNVGYSGGTLSAEQYGRDGVPRHWICRSIDEIRRTYPSLSYLILEGGTNDADNLGEDERLFGRWDSTDMDGPFDDTTYTGAIESLFRKARTYFPNAKLGVLIAHTMGMRSREPDVVDRRRRYFLRLMELCRKWGVPYLDLWSTAPLDPDDPDQYDPACSGRENVLRGSLYADGQHLTSAGYDVLAPYVEQFVRSL